MNKNEKKFKLDYTIDNKWSLVYILNLPKRELRL